MSRYVQSGDFLKHKTGATAQIHSITIKSEHGQCYFQITLLTADGIRILRSTDEEFKNDWEIIEGELHF